MLNGSLLPNKFNNIKEPSVFATGISENTLQGFTPLQLKQLNLFNLANFNYLDIFAEDTQLLEEWLEWTRWLKFDCIMLDYLRLNHLVDGDLTGTLDWIILNDDSLHLALFTKISNNMTNSSSSTTITTTTKKNDFFRLVDILSDSTVLLQVWYTYDEFQKWIIQYKTTNHNSLASIDDRDRIYDIDNSDTDQIIYTNINMEVLPVPIVKKLLHELKQKHYLELVYNFHFNDETRDLSNMDFNDTAASLSSASSFMPSSDHTSSPKRRNIKRRKLKLTLTNDIKSIKETCIKLKNLTKISCNGYKLFDLMINAHGFRDRSGNTISYLVKNRAKALQLNQMPFLTHPNNFTDLTRWNTLTQLKLTNINTIDLNTLILPENCSQLIINNCQELKWWDIYQKITTLPLSHDDKFELTQCCPNGFDNCIKGYCNHTKDFFFQFDETDWSPEDKIMILNCLNKILNGLNIIQLTTVRIHNFFIVPRSLYMDERFTFRRSSAEKIILL